MLVWHYMDLGGFLGNRYKDSVGVLLGKLGLVCSHHKSGLVGWELLHERLSGTFLQTILLHDQSLLLLHLEIVLISQTPADITDPQPS